MNASRYRFFLTGTLIAALATIVGLWLPLLQKLPVDYVDGKPVFTMELTWGLNAGFRGIDLLLVALALVAVASVLVASVVASHRRPWPTNAVLVAVGGFTVFVAGQRLASISRTERYAAEPGIYLLLAGSLLFVVFGLVGAGLRWYRPLREWLSVGG